MMLDRLKQLLKILDVLTTQHQVELRFRDITFKGLRTLFWNAASQQDFDVEIAPYFEAIPSGFKPQIIVDAGGYAGYFSIGSALLYPTSKVYVFEPSLRNRRLIQRQVSLNHLSTRVEVVPHALWNETTHLSFRTHGTISSIVGVGSLPSYLDFSERIPAVSLDDWVRLNSIRRIDLIKMDIEGAEIEALQGAREVLQNFKPLLLLQAYHLRNEGRTYEVCVKILDSLNYGCVEVNPSGGFMIAKHKDAKFSMDGGSP